MSCTCLFIVLKRQSVISWVWFPRSGARWVCPWSRQPSWPAAMGSCPSASCKLQTSCASRWVLAVSAACHHPPVTSWCKHPFVLLGHWTWCTTNLRIPTPANGWITTPVCDRNKFTFERTAPPAIESVPQCMLCVPGQLEKRDCAAYLRQFLDRKNPSLNHSVKIAEIT